MNTKLQEALEKLASPWMDIEYSLNILFKYQENDWIYPTNKDDEAYQVCKLLSDLNLVESKKTPLWDNGSFKGLRVEFRYNKDLKY